jgi:hypothetical protein
MDSRSPSRIETLVSTLTSQYFTTSISCLTALNLIRYGILNDTKASTKIGELHKLITGRPQPTALLYRILYQLPTPVSTTEIPENNNRVVYTALNLSIPESPSSLNAAFVKLWPPNAPQTLFTHAVFSETHSVYLSESRKVVFTKLNPSPGETRTVTIDIDLFLVLPMIFYLSLSTSDECVLPNLTSSLDFSSYVEMTFAVITSTVFKKQKRFIPFSSLLNGACKTLFTSTGIHHALFSRLLSSLPELYNRLTDKVLPWKTDSHASERVPFVVLPLCCHTLRDPQSPHTLMYYQTYILEFDTSVSMRLTNVPGSFVSDPLLRRILDLPHELQDGILLALLFERPADLSACDTNDDPSYPPIEEDSIHIRIRSPRKPHPHEFPNSVRPQPYTPVHLPVTIAFSTFSNQSQTELSQEILSPDSPYPTEVFHTDRSLCTPQTRNYMSSTRSSPPPPCFAEGSYPRNAPALIPLMDHDISSSHRWCAPSDVILPTGTDNFGHPLVWSRACTDK